MLAPSGAVHQGTFGPRDDQRVEGYSAESPGTVHQRLFLPRPRFADGQLRSEYAWVEDFVALVHE